MQIAFHHWARIGARSFARLWGRSWFPALLFLAPPWGMSPSQMSQISSPPSKNLPSSQISSPQNPLPSPSEEHNNSYVPGRLIVQFKTESNHNIGLRSCAHCLFEKNKSFRSASSDDSDSLDRLFENYRPQRIKALYRSSEEEGQSTEAISVQALRSQWEGKLAASKSRFANRARRAQTARPDPELFHIYRIDFAADTDIELAAIEFSKDPHVEFAHPDYIMGIMGQEIPVGTNNNTPQLTHAIQPTYPNDPYFYSQGSWGQNYSDLWGIKRTQALQLWRNANKGQGITVAVVDTGVDYTHPDLAENIWFNEEEIANDGIDQDGNGYIDDSMGWNFSRCAQFVEGVCVQAQEPSPDPIDHEGHGTHVAGTIAAVGNNGLGIIGMAPKAKIMAVKALNDLGQGASSDLAEAMVYAVLNGADIVNNSWGCRGRCYSVPDFEGPVQLAYNHGVVLVFSAGNFNDEAAFYYPQNAPETITVAASSYSDTRWNFSNYGPEVDIAAPGGESAASESDYMANSILSLRAANSDLYGLGGTAASGQMIVNDIFYRAKGTSMACPHVSGAIALMMVAHPDWDIEEIRFALRSSVDPITSTDPVEYFNNWGRLNVAKAVNPNTPPMKINILSPRSGIATDWTSNSTVVRGTATGERFHHYQLSYRRRWWDPWHSDQWYPIGGPVYTPVENGDLGVWNWAGQDNGAYLLRLTVTDVDGMEHSDIVHTFLECVINSSPALTASDNEFCDRIRVSWTTVPFSEAYLLKRGLVQDFDWDDGESLGLQQGTSFEDSNVESGIPYYYRVLPYNVCQTTPHYSNTNAGMRAFIPQVVSGISASDGEFCNYVKVQWNLIPGVNHYTIWRSSVNLTSAAFLIGTVTNGQNFHDDYSISQNDENYYWVLVGGNGCNPEYGFGVPDLGSRVHTGIGVPLNVVASDGNPCDNIRVTWQAASNAQNYRIWRSTSSSLSGAIQIGGSTSSPFFDNSAAAGVFYWYWVEARNSCNASGMSISNMGVYGPPLAPNYVEVSQGDNCNYVGILWTPSDDADNYKVYRSANPSGSNPQYLGQTNGNFWDDNSATPGTFYYYFVKASNSCGLSPSSSIQLGYRPLSLGAVQNVFATNGSNCSIVHITWDLLPTAINYKIYRSTTNNSNSAIFIGNAGTDSFNDGTGTPGVHYYYWVRGENSCGLGSFSNSNEGWRCNP